jgi:hypothetical protein
LELSCTRLWSVPENSEYRATTTGVVYVDGAQACFSLENTALMIPAGTYSLKLQWSERFERKTPWILDVPGRTAIEVHGGNVAIDSDGCILVAIKRINDYVIYESAPATDYIESKLAQDETSNLLSTITISGPD